MKTIIILRVLITFSLCDTLDVFLKSSDMFLIRLEHFKSFMAQQFIMRKNVWILRPEKEKRLSLESSCMSESKLWPLCLSL